MIIARNDSEQEFASEITMRRLNMMISTALILSDERNELEMIAYTYTEEEANEKIEYLKEFLPQVGYHTVPHGMEDINRAVKYSVDKDDFYDRTISST